MSMSVHMFVFGCMFVFIFYPFGCRQGRRGQDVTCVEALQKAGQIMSGDLCIHVSALRRVWSVREHKYEAMLFQCAVTQCVLGFCLIPILLFVIHPAWHQVLVTALPVPPGPWEEHSIPSKDRAY